MPIDTVDTYFFAECLVPNGLKQSDVEPLNKLLAEFSPKAQPLRFSDWREMTTNNFLFVIRSAQGEMAGMATLIINRIPTGHIGFVEDVVVAKKFHRQGAGRKLMKALIQVARERGLKQLDLTSRPERRSANHLYQQLGFRIRETNNYRLTLL